MVLMDSCGDGGTNDRLKGQVFAPLASLGDPAFQRVDLGWRKGTAQFGRWHLLLGIFADEAADQPARIGMAFGNDAIAVAVPFGLGFILETPIAFSPFLGLGAVALEPGARAVPPDLPPHAAGIRTFRPPVGWGPGRRNRDDVESPGRYAHRGLPLAAPPSRYGNAP